jgi:hypothetical protein
VVGVYRTRKKEKKKKKEEGTLRLLKEEKLELESHAREVKVIRLRKAKSTLNGISRGQFEALQVEN